MMRLFVLLPLLMLGCQPATTATQDGSQAAFITLLGEDTLAVERFQYTESGLVADVMLRTPQTTVHRYDIRFDDADGFLSYEAIVRDPADDSEMRRETVTLDGDSLVYAVARDGETQERTVAATDDALPFVDMVHWPFDIVLQRAHATGLDSLTQPLFTGRGQIPFVVRNHGDRRMSLEHPFRGTMDVEVDAEGRLVRLDAGRTTRALTVERVPNVDVDAVAARFVTEDEAGRSFGALSGRDETIATVNGATISLDFGQPSKRGRTIWGELVDWGRLWRTGANRATHIQTDRALRFEGLDLPAGTYTLFSIPEQDGGVLIINEETGQNGNSYDAAHDLGHVPMQPRTLDNTVEDFRIEIAETDSGGELSLEWDRTAFVVPFEVID